MANTPHPPPTNTVDDTSLPTFIAPKHRKATIRRRRSSSPASDSDPPRSLLNQPPTLPTTTSSSPSFTPPSTSSTPSLPTLIRTSRPKRRLGLGVSAPRPSTLSKHANADSISDDDAARAASEAEVLAVINRFTHQTGQILDVDKHMMKYIESRMSTRKVSPGSQPAAAAADTPASQPDQKSSYWAPTRPEARGATLGKLHEVDLGEEARARNIALTQAALNPSSTTSAMTTPHTNPRRKRRTSQDIERDRLVEEVLRETRLEIYTPEEADEVADSEEAADDRIAERFRKEFIDAIISKRRRKGGDGIKGGAGGGGGGGGAGGGKGGKDDKKRPKGPKLGGSRMARAQMREREVAAGAAKK